MNALALDGVVEDTFDCVIAKVCERGGAALAESTALLARSFQSLEDARNRIVLAPPHAHRDRSVVMFNARRARASLSCFHLAQGTVDAMMVAGKEGRENCFLMVRREK